MWQSLIESVSHGGPAAILLLIGLVVAIVRRWLVPGWWYKETVRHYEVALAAKEAEVVELKDQRAILMGQVREPRP